ncbi:MAG: DUF5820 family protein [Haloarculaceae archaeon]
MEDLADGWVVWSESEDRLVFTYRPDVFTGERYPPACLPTIYVTRGGRSRRPGVDLSPGPDADWHVRLFLEPEVARASDRYEDRAAALAGARDLAARFAGGEIDARALYQVTDDREAYLDRLAALTGREA